MVIPQNIDLALFVLRLALCIILFATGPAAVYKEFRKKQRATANLGRGILETIAGFSILLGPAYGAAVSILLIFFLYDIFIKVEIKDTPFVSVKNGWKYEFVILTISLTLLLAGTGSYIITF